MILLSGIRANQQTAWEGKQLRKNREAEESHVRRTVWGEQDSGGGGGVDDEMGDQIHFGDITQHHHHSKPAGMSGIAKGLAAAGLAAAGLGAGAAIPIAVGYLNKAAQPPAVGIDTDTNTKYGLQIYRDE